jgi:ATP-dependent DNA ligase
MEYTKYKYIFPPRPKNAVPKTALPTYDNDSYMAQYKFNGSNCVIMMNSTDVRIMNRHSQPMSNFKIKDDIRKLYIGDNWIVLNGEYMNKSKKDECGKVFNQKLILFDILVYDGKYLVGKTFEERYNLLHSLFDKIPSDKPYIDKLNDSVYLIKNIDGNICSEYEDITKVDMIEGLVVKRKKAPLEMGLNELNNVKFQIKCRKPTKLYQY